MRGATAPQLDQPISPDALEAAIPEFPQLEPEHYPTPGHSYGSELGGRPELPMHETPAAAAPPAGADLPDANNTPARNPKPPLFLCYGHYHCKRKTVYVLFYPLIMVLNILTYQSWPHKCKIKGCRYEDGTPKTTTITCEFDKCSAVFKNIGEFNRHYRCVHIKAAKHSKLDCTFEGCYRVGEEGFTRKDNLIQHLRNVHGEVITKNPVRFNGRLPNGQAVQRS